MQKKVLFITQAAMIAALYVVLTFIANAFGLAGDNAVQVRFSEALTILPFFITSAIPGLTIGCLLANFLTGAHWLDIIFGSTATLIGAVFTYFIGKMARSYQKSKKPKANQIKWLAPLPPIISNAVIVPFILLFAYGIRPLWLSAIFVALGQVISCGILGMMLLFALEKRNIFKLEK
ncbi:MAG: QueT transporter family protein [Lachnospiraceae bacterium]|nr:QueT transporter family protein [Lachnospiraceae bacterium]